MLARETDEPFDDKEWLFEIKWDGYRAVTEKKDDDILLYSRNGLSFNTSYPIIVHELLKITEDAVLDGEIVVLNKDGRSDFQLLQHYSENTDKPILYYVFDLLQLNGHDTTKLPLKDRKELLQKLIPKNNVIKYSDHIIEKGKAFFKLSGEKGLEGIMAKRMDSEYYPGKRTGDWLKIKHHKTQEAIIVGFTEPSGARKFFGALILAVKDGNEFKYVGHTGGGFTDELLKEMYEQLRPLIVKSSPFREKVETNTPVTWVKPKLICEVKFAEITESGRLRQPIFLHLRKDKNINEVTMPVSTNAAAKKRMPAGQAEEPAKGDEKIFSFGKTKVKVSNPHKILFPKDQITKEDIVNYYLSVSEYILPYLKGRPESLLRNPNGIHEPGFFQKDNAGHIPPFAKSKKIFSESNQKEIDYIICDNAATLTYLNNLGCIELNPWHSTVDKLDNPDYIIIDIDPSSKNTFDQVVEAANAVKEILDKAGAPSFCKTSGASGLHVYIPAQKKYDYEHAKDFANIICMMATEQIKDFATLERNLQKRSDKKIYMDYLQNRRGQTIACAYSLRPRDGATVSAPLHWKEVKKGLSPQQFTIHNMLQRIKKQGDLFSGILGKGVDLNKCLKNLGA